MNRRRPGGKITSIPTHRPHHSVQAACHRRPGALLAKSAVELKLQAKWNKQRGRGTRAGLSKKPERDGKSVLKQTPDAIQIPVCQDLRSTLAVNLENYF